MGPVLRFKRGVTREIRRELREFFRHVADVVRFEHELPVIVVPCPVVSVERGAGFGGFCIQEGKPQVFIGGQTDEEIGYTLADIIETAAHELAHYEQFRDGRELTERGVNVRARNILKASRGVA
jgi:hypothetical protein